MSEVKSSVSRWQIKLLPFVINTLTVLIASFLVVGSIYVFSMNKKNDEMIDNHFNQFHSIDTEWKNLSDETKALLILEEKSMNYRFVQSINTNKYNVWTRFTMYLIGTIMCFVGAIFILSKISEEQTTFSGESGPSKIDLRSSSPGLILAFFGSILIIFAINKSNIHNFNDAPRYIIPKQTMPSSSYGGLKNSLDNETKQHKPFDPRKELK